MEKETKNNWSFEDQDVILSDLKGLIQIVSTNGDAGEVTDEAPLGERINQAIDYVVDLGHKYGFRGKNLDGYVGWLEIGPEDAEEMVGILSHVDVVPVSDGWSYPPHDTTIKDGKIFGRGTLDDKGPLVATLHAMKAVNDSGVPLDRRIRVIFGGDEESGRNRCMEHYKKTEEIPTVAFSPDADYPVIFAEKGIQGIKIYADDLKGDDLKLESGTVINIVPDKASAQVNGKEYSAQGTAAHAMEPEKGDNALLKLGKMLEKEGVKHPFLDLLDMANVKDLNIALSDDVSGNLTFNPAVAHVDGPSASLECDIRYPVTLKPDQFDPEIAKAVAPLGFKVEETKHLAPLYVKRDSELVQKLLKVYEDYIGEKAEPISLGGGTYAREFDNAVAFGILFPGEENMCHQTDEYWSLNDLQANLQIIADAIQSLGTK